MDQEQNNPRKSAADDINIDQIGQGNLYSKGASSGGSGNKGWGLKGQLSQYRKRGGRTETKNLSKQNLDDMENLISSRIKGNSSRSSAIVSRQDSLNIMKKAEELVKTEGSNFTRQDKEDLKNVVSTMRIKSRQALRSRPLNNTNELKNSSSTTVSDINEFLVD